MTPHYKTYIFGITARFGFTFSLSVEFGRGGCYNYKARPPTEPRKSRVAALAAWEPRELLSKRPSYELRNSNNNKNSRDGGKCDYIHLNAISSRALFCASRQIICRKRFRNEKLLCVISGVKRGRWVCRGDD